MESGKHLAEQPVMLCSSIALDEAVAGREAVLEGEPGQGLDLGTEREGGDQGNGEERLPAAAGVTRGAGRRQDKRRGGRGESGREVSGAG